MKFIELHHEYLEQAVKMGTEEFLIYGDSDIISKDFDIERSIRKLLEYIFEKGKGVLAVEGDVLKGYMLFWAPIPQLFGKVKGAFSPMSGSCFGTGDRYKMATKLFLHASDMMKDEEIFSYGICAYSKDTEVMKSLFINGFGARCADGVIDTNKRLAKSINEDCVYEEISYNDAEALYDLFRELSNHMFSSPTYLYCEDVNKEQWIQKCNEMKPRFFVAKDGERVVGFTTVEDTGETVLSNYTKYKHLSHTYLLPDYRGRGIMESLLEKVLESLRAEGIDYLGVDCETLNPNAYGFWKKHFNIYTHSLVRRVDERIK